ncbi:MAG TPA: DUF1294 domain-containing protein [Methanospirillum sp.]|jgi:uncharacterized membrane protein YsdA (DUF1294 family)|uniref:DUF1294 domain-containing protein n=1 Tax=Methanospirillum sp. TaxID=45200 RepID=UPI001BD4475B|nr:DUF1294 domain-containing protein [Methanospirillum sp.]HQC00007.1 DUF1294 domain-containing protein [Methanospirillum sp.]
MAFTLFIPYLVVNAITFALFGYDKQRAMREEYRIPERNLVTLAFFGPLGAYAGMRVFRHKIRKPLFSTMVPVFILIHAGIYIMLISGYLPG